MRATPLGFLMAFALTGATISECHADDTATRKELAARYMQIEQALKKRDAKSLDALLAKNYVFISLDSKHSDKQTLLNREKDTSKHPAVAFHEKIVKLHVKDNLTDVEATEIDPFKSFDKQNKPGMGAVVYTFHDQWVKSKQGWQLKRSQVVKQSETFNGKPVN